MPETEALSIIKTAPSKFKTLGPLKNNKEFIISAVSTNYEVLKYISDKFKKDKEVILAAVNTYGKALEYVSPELQADKEVVLAAVFNYGHALEYASSELQADKEVVLVAITSRATSLNYASPELQADKEVVLVAVAKEAYSLKYASSELKGDKEVVLTAISNSYLDDTILKYASKELQADKEVVLAAISKNVDSFKYASIELRGDNDVKSAAGAVNYSIVLKYAPKELQSNEQFLNEIDYYISQITDMDSFLRIIKKYSKNKELIVNSIKKHIDLFDPNYKILYILIGLGNSELIQIILNKMNIKINWAKDIEKPDFYKRKEILEKLEKSDINLYESLDLAIKLEDNKTIKNILDLRIDDEYKNFFHYALEELAKKNNLTMIEYILNIYKDYEYFFTDISCILEAIDLQNTDKYIELENYIIDNYFVEDANYAPLLKNAFSRKDMIRVEFLMNKYNFNEVTIHDFLIYLVRSNSSEEIIKKILTKYQKLDLEEAIIDSIYYEKIIYLNLLLDYAFNNDILDIDLILKRSLSYSNKGNVPINAVKILIEYGANIQHIKKIKDDVFENYPYLKDAFNLKYSSLGKYIFDLKNETYKLKATAKKVQNEKLIDELGIFPDLEKYIKNQKNSIDLNKVFKLIDKDFDNFWNLDKEYYENEEVLIYATKEADYSNFFRDCYYNEIKCLDNPKLQSIMIEKFGSDGLYYDNKYIKPKDFNVIIQLVHKDPSIFFRSKYHSEFFNLNISKKLCLGLIETYNETSKCDICFEYLPKSIIEDNQLLIKLAQKSMLNIDVLYNLKEFNEELTIALITNLKENSWETIRKDYKKFKNFVKDTPLFQIIQNDEKILVNLKKFDPSWNI